MITFEPLIDECPADLQGNEKMVMNICINGKRFNLPPFTIERIRKHSQLDLHEISEAINELAKRSLIHAEGWV